MLLNAAGTEVDRWNQRAIGVGVVTFALLVHGFAPKYGIYLQNVLGAFKIVVLLFVIFTGFAALGGHVPGGSPHNFTNAFEGTKTDANSFVSALYNVIWSFIGEHLSPGCFNSPLIWTCRLLQRLLRHV